MFQEAVDVCRAGLSVHPGYLSARVTLGRALVELQQFDAAQTELEQVLRSAPENLAAIRGLADVFYRQGVFAQALAQYRAALKIVRHDPDLEQAIEELEQKVQPEETASPNSPEPIKIHSDAAAEQERTRAVATLAALEQLLTAVHVARAQRFA